MRRSQWVKGGQETPDTSSELSRLLHPALRLRGTATLPRLLGVCHATQEPCASQLSPCFCPHPQWREGHIWWKVLFCTEGLQDSWRKQAQRRLVTSISSVITKQTRVGSDSGLFHLGICETCGNVLNSSRPSRCWLVCSGQPLPAAWQTSTQTNPALVLLLLFLLLRKRDQDNESHLRVIWAAPATCRYLLQSMRPHFWGFHCSSTGFCISNKPAASLPARSLVSSQLTCQYWTETVVCSMQSSPEPFKSWLSTRVGRLHGILQEKSLLIHLRYDFLPQ